jgi:hypothetical protein
MKRRTAGGARRRLAAGTVTAGDAATGSISGVLFNDQNGDGVCQDGEPPLAGFQAFLDLNGNNVLDSEEPVATRDQTGQYTFDYLAPGSYTVLPMRADGLAVQRTFRRSGGVLGRSEHDCGLAADAEGPGPRQSLQRRQQQRRPRRPRNDPGGVDGICGPQQ